MSDDELPKADPMAAARAAKARKAMERAEAELQQAEKSAAPAAGEQPTLSTLRGGAVATYDGEPVEMRVTHWGHGEISTGGVFGFERYAKGAIFMAPEQSARALFNKRWAEPTDPAYGDRWNDQNGRDARTAAQRGARERYVLEHGVNANEEWSTGRDA